MLDTLRAASCPSRKNPRAATVLAPNPSRDSPPSFRADNWAETCAHVRAVRSPWANAAGGGVVYFPAGTYLVTQSLPLYQVVYDDGDGANLSLIKQDDAVIDFVARNFALVGPSEDRPGANVESPGDGPRLAEFTHRVTVGGSS